jgi:hypothetical protein
MAVFFHVISVLCHVLCNAPNRSCHFASKLSSEHSMKYSWIQLQYMQGTEYFVSTVEYNVMVNSEELIGTTEYMTL